MRQHPWLFLAGVLLAGPRGLAAQWQTPPDAHDFSKLKGADSALVTWVERDNMNEHLIKMRNNARYPAEITEWEIFSCINIRSKDCRVHAKPTRIEPGKTITLQVVRRDYVRSGWQWRYRFKSRFLVPNDTVLLARDQIPDEIRRRLPPPAPWQGAVMGALQREVRPTDVRFHTGLAEYLEFTVPRPELAPTDPAAMDSLRHFAEVVARAIPLDARLDSIRVHLETAPSGERRTRITSTFPMAVLRRSPATGTPP